MFSCKFKYVSTDRLAMRYAGQVYMLDRKAVADPPTYVEWRLIIATRIQRAVAQNVPIMLSREEFCYVSRNRARTHF